NLKPSPISGNNLYDTLASRSVASGLPLCQYDKRTTAARFLGWSSCSSVAKKYGVDKATVSRVCSKFRQEVPEGDGQVGSRNLLECSQNAMTAIVIAISCENFHVPEQPVSPSYP